ncbi:MAG TPA: DUF1015 domain-containing protein [Candidatus Nanopelagicaceae bacterium]|nr:DUF1015 domain-containing protein [Candidatus Nanopelagicaceae bacterium]
MAQVSPFTGIRYDPARIDLADVLAPPYDVIGEALQGELYSRAMQNMVRVELGKDYPGDAADGADRYTRARDHLRTWLDQGFLTRDPEPSLYLHRHSFQLPGDHGRQARLGCFASVEPVAHERREVLRHELTMSGPREDRLRLLQATRTQTSPVFLLYEDCPEVSATMQEQVRLAAPVGDAVTDGDFGPERHELWRVTDPAALASICGALSNTHLFIADGHHRYETALRLHLPGVLALLAPLRDPGNVILPTHRLLPKSRLSADELATNLSGVGWDVAVVPAWPDIPSRLAELRPTHHAFGILDSGSQFVVGRRRQAEARSGAAAGLDVAVLDREIMEAQLGVVPKDSELGLLRYIRDPEEVAAQAQARAALGFLLSPTSVEEMAEVALAGEAMPQKSTYFFPKVPAGLVLMDAK